MAPRLEPESRRLLTAFSANLNRWDPQPLDWQRFYDFILYAFGHEPPSAEAVGHALVQNGLDWASHGHPNSTRGAYGRNRLDNQGGGAQSLAASSGRSCS
jgi:hypothetical protein